MSCATLRIGFDHSSEIPMIKSPLDGYEVSPLMAGRAIWALQDLRSLRSDVINKLSITKLQEFSWVRTTGYLLMMNFNRTQ